MRRLVLPFAGAYFLSYLYRTANAVVGPILVQELSLSAGAIGLLTGSYFLAFALAQLPLGMLLDRFGARRVEPALLLVAAAGALAFSAGGSLAGLAAGRALIGLGVSACLMGALHSFWRSFPAERQASLTGWIMTSGGLGALAASAPLEAALRLASWRQVFVALAAATVAAALWIFRSAPEQPPAPGAEGMGRQWAGVAAVFGSARFWRVAPLGLTFTGGFMAVQGLWSGSWLLHVNGLSRAAAADHLAAMNLAMLLSYAAIGISATPLARRGVQPVHLVGGGVALALAALLAIAAEATPRTLPLWIAFGAFSSFGTLAYPVAAQGFPAALAGRASTALNLLVFVGAFGIQWGLGVAIDALRAGGLGDAAAHRAAFGGLLGAQVLAYAWFAVSGRRAAS
ncbi:MAG TPA: MFS transporter [Anaeromyxobacteraceae bacterium]|nr:MFS transporter [Anaeromyxobacteraceae bacterium]